MGIKVGLVGLPNVGKSTLFNALTKSSVPAENYPFCTIEPHTAMTEVPDKRISELSAIYNSAKNIYSTISFVDIAGLVKGAASGEGLGNQFLSHIREVDLIVHVLRCFQDEDVVNAATGPDPLSDLYVIATELMLKDLESIGKRLGKIETLRRGAVKNPRQLKALDSEKAFLERVKKLIDSNDYLGLIALPEEDKKKTIELLSLKDFLIVANISQDDNGSSGAVKLLEDTFGADKVIPICARTELELAQIDDESEKTEMLTLLGLEERGLDEFIRKSYSNLDLITFFTCGPKEVHAWPIKKGTTIRSAAGEIHSDLERGFICAEVYNYDDIIRLKNEGALKTAGKIRTEGRDYVVQDGDIINIRFNV